MLNFTFIENTQLTSSYVVNWFCQSFVLTKSEHCEEGTKESDIMETSMFVKTSDAPAA